MEPDCGSDLEEDYGREAAKGSGGLERGFNYRDVLHHGVRVPGASSLG